MKPTVVDRFDRVFPKLREPPADVAEVDVPGRLDVGVPTGAGAAPPAPPPPPPPKFPGVKPAVAAVLDDDSLDTSTSSTGLREHDAEQDPHRRPPCQRERQRFVTNWNEIFPFDDPIAFSTPISRRRSRTIITMLSKMMTAPATSAPIRL